MPWVRFTAPFNWRVKIKPHVVISYKAGQSYLVKQRCADDAVKARKAVLIPRESRTHAGR